MQKEHAAIDMQNALEKVGTEVMVGTSGGRETPVMKVLMVWMENRIIMESQGHLEKKDMGEIGA